MSKAPQSIDSAIYEPVFVRSLFDEMSSTYGLVNVITSFGFCILWREQCARLIDDYEDGDRIVDLMSGMAELTLHVRRKVTERAEILGIDLSTVMCATATETISRKGLTRCRAEVGDALATGLPDGSVDAAVSTFGLKTFDDDQLRQLALECRRVLRPGGRVAFLEISVPAPKILRCPFMFYIRKIIPVLGRILMGNPDNYRLLGVYTEAFENCDKTVGFFEEAGFKVEPKSFFFGCATGFAGIRE